MRKIVSLLFIVGLFSSINAWAQKPTVVSVDKSSGSGGDIVTLNGSDFGTDKTDLRIFFGAVAGEIKTVRNQLIEVKTPAGATYDEISVTNITNGLTGYAPTPYLLTFSGQDALTASSFAPQSNLTSKLGLYDLCLCDLNNDSRPDIVSANGGSPYINIYKNGSTVGTIAFATDEQLININSQHVTCGDLNGDGLPDLVFTEGGAANRIVILRNTGAYTFAAPQTLTIPGRKVKQVAIADLDLDGKPELAVTDSDNQFISILPNLSTLTTIVLGTPTYVTIPGAIKMDALQIKDVNGNGLPDLITSQYQVSPGNVFICDNKSSPGLFNFSDVTTLAADQTIINLRVGDLDGDQKPDIAATRFLGSDIVVFRNQSTATQMAFASPVSLLTNEEPWGLDFGDLNGDGSVDIAVTSIETKSITILANQSVPGAISFKPMIASATDFITRHISIGDLDGDGKPDLAFASVENQGNGVSEISIKRNRSCFVPELSPKGPLNVCTGLDLKLTSSSASGVTYEWKNNGTTIPGTDPFLNVTATGPYTVTAHSESGTCSKTSNIVNVTVSAPGAGLSATDPNARSNSPVCTDNTLSLIVDEVGASAYRWTGPNGFAATGRIPVRDNFTLAHAGWYAVEMLSGSCVAKTDSVLVEGINNPHFTLTFSGTGLICEGSTKTLTVSPVMTSGFTYKWYEESQGQLGGQANATLTVSNTGNYYAEVKSVHPGCAAVPTEKVSLTRVAVPVAGFSPSAASGCTGQEFTFNNQSVVDPQATPTYAWTFGGGLPASSAISPTVIYSTDGNYQVKLRVTYQNESCPNEETISVSVIKGPAINITPDPSAGGGLLRICAEDTLRLGVQGATFTSYTWSSGETTPTILIGEGADYSVTVITDQGCVLTAGETVGEYATPQVTASVKDDKTSIQAGDRVILNADGLQSYVWRPALSLNDSTIANPTATPLQDIVYTVSGRDINGCYGEASIAIRVTGASAIDTIQPKNYFSPNGDDKNPFWTIVDIESFPECAVFVYNDKGSKVFEAKPYNNDWTGTFKGSQLPAGVYYYVIRCDGDANVKTGSLTLLK